MTQKAEASPSLFAIARTFFWIGVFSFGGGITGWIHQEVVARHHWMSDEQVLAGLALAQVLPGVNVTNLCVFVGNELRGWAGAMTALASLLAGPVILCVGVLMIYAKIAAIPLLHAAVDGVAAAAVGLNLRIGIAGAARVIPKPGPTLALVVTFVAVGVLQWPLVPVVLVVAPLSIAACWPWRRAGA